MSLLARFVLVGVVILGLLSPQLPVMAGSAPLSDAPAQSGREIRSALFDAEAALLAGHSEDAVRAASEAAASVENFLPAIGDSVDRDAIRTAVAAAQEAAKRGDASALSLAHGRVWSALVAASFHETLTAARAGDADTAAAWLLLRDFRPTTIFARPSADATQAVVALRQGEVAPEAAAAAISADLLDTYQARLESALDEVSDATADGLTAGQAQSLGLATGYWRILSPSYREQVGAGEGAKADTAFQSLLRAGDAGDLAQLQRQATATMDVVRSFRAAPLSTAELARRGGQLLRYLSLVPVEYGRGVKGGQVTLDLEIQEAAAFLDGARGAFAELRLPLRDIDATATNDVATELDSLQQAIAAAASHETVAAPAAIERQAAVLTETLKGIYPKAWLAQSGDSDFDVLDSLLDQVLAAAAAGQYQQAESSRVEAYAIFETGPEKRLLAFTPDEALRVERLFWEGDGQTHGLHALLTNHAGINELTATREALDHSLADAQAALAAGTAPAAIIFNSATIVFREGLEAVLILASLLASMIGANRQFKRPLALGAFAALLVTALLFVLAQNALLSFGHYSEQLEAIVSVIAIGVLLLVMNWFFHKVYWTRWIAKHHEHRRRLLIGGIAGQALGFVLLGFSSVFREGAETVLFLQALVLDAGPWIVVQGVLLGLAGTGIVAALTLVMHAKLPHKKMLIVTGVMIATVLVTMVGSTVHTVQLVGWMPISPIPGAERLPYWLGVWFGVHGTWQGLIAQLAALVFVFGSYFLAEHQQPRGRKASTGATLPLAGGQGNPIPAA
ncbi:MAG: FTR1 family protein [Thermomicrobiales bacterium]